jgi:hypothetical protein
VHIAEMEIQKLEQDERILQRDVKLNEHSEKIKGLETTQKVTVKKEELEEIKKNEMNYKAQLGIFKLFSNFRTKR